MANFAKQQMDLPNGISMGYAVPQRPAEVCRLENASGIFLDMLRKRPIDDKKKG